MSKPSKPFLFATWVVSLVAACSRPGSSPSPAPPVSAAPPISLDEAKQSARSEALLELANDDLTKGRFLAAKRRAEEALAQDPGLADAHAVIGAAQWRAGDIDASTRAFEQALALNATHFGASLGLARNLQTQGAHRSAAELLEPLLAEDPGQVDPLLAQLWSYYTLLDAKQGVSTVDRIFELLPADEPLLPSVQAVAAFLRPLESVGPLCTIHGEQGQMDAGLNHDYALKFSSAILGEDFVRVVISEAREEALIDPAWVAALGLTPLAQFIPLGGTEKLPLVLIPELRFGELRVRNVPALVTDLAPYAAAVGERPGVVLGRQALQAFGSYTFDFPRRTLVVRRTAPPAESKGEIELPLRMLNLHVLQVPAVPVKIDGSEQPIHVYWGGFERSSLALTRKAYLKAGHLPRELDPLDDAERGLKMVYLHDVILDEHHLGGAGGLVMTLDPPDSTLDLVLQNTAFELGGYLNTRMMSEWAVTYALGEGKLYIRLPD